MTTVIKLPEFIENDNHDDDKPKKVKAKGVACFCLRRLTRIILMLFASGMTIYVCILSSERYFKYWVQTTIDRTDVHVSQIAFPAVTICPTRIAQNTFNNTDKSQKEKRMLGLYNLAQKVHWRKERDLQGLKRDLQEYEDFSNQTLLNVDSVFNYGYKCEELFVQCTWRRQVVDCCRMLFRRLSFGSCYAFNLVHAENPDPTWPWSVADAGIKSALTLKINRYVRGTKLEAVGVIVHEPTEFVGSSVIYTSDDRIMLSLQPLHFTAEPAVKSRPVNMRYCYFPDELTQTYSDCITRCHLNYTSTKCGCNYNLPIPEKFGIHIDLGISNAKANRTCTVKDLPCLQKNGVSIFYMGNIIEESTDNVFNTTDCKCYPSCSHTQYHAVTFTDRRNSGGGKLNEIDVDVHFQEETLFAYRSTLHITMLDLMVSYGGIAGLFLGLSVIGAINALLDRIACCRKPLPDSQAQPQPLKPDHEPERVSCFCACKKNP